MIDLTEITYKRIMGREPMEKSPNDDAEVFLKGNCNMFALALHHVYGYPIYKFNGFEKHYFCMKDGKYIDVRGVMDEITTSISRHKIKPEEIVVAEEYMPENDIETEAYDFAKEIIKQNKGRYVL